MTDTINIFCEVKAAKGWVAQTCSLHPDLEVAQIAAALIDLLTQIGLRRRETRKLRALAGDKPALLGDTWAAGDPYHALDDFYRDPVEDMLIVGVTRLGCRLWEITKDKQALHEISEQALNEVRDFHLEACLDHAWNSVGGVWWS